MPDERTYGFNKDDAQSLVQSISNGEDWFPEIKPRGGRVEYAVILDDALAVATNSKTGATSCLATVCVWDASINDYVETATQKTVWNHSESTEYAIDTFGSARTIDGHLWFFGDCAPMASM